MNKERNSNFELLRLILIFFIITYHFLVFIFINETHECESLYKALWLPLHIAVICFVLISGYFHIRPSLKGAVKLLLPLFLYYVLPCLIAGFFKFECLEGKHEEYLLFFSKSPYWFIKTYFYLFLVSPLLNKWLDTGSIKDKTYVLLVFLFIGVYEALMGDASVANGKNVVLFMFLYILGDFIREKEDSLSNFKLANITIGWILFNIIMVLVWLYFNNGRIGNIIWRLSFPYSSPILILNAVWLFIIFSRIHFQSRLINRIAQSVFAVYILTEHLIIKPVLLQPSLTYIYDYCNNHFLTILFVTIFSVVVIAICVLVDHAFQPVFKKILNRLK